MRAHQWVVLHLRRFNGAAFFQSGKWEACLYSSTPQGKASMEPLFFKAENAPAPDETTGNAPASMEPLFFKAENKLLWWRRRAGQIAASMEPLFFKAENRTLTSPLFSKTCRVSCER